MFTFRERFVASDVWMRLWLVGSFCFAFYLLLSLLEPPLSAIRSPAYWLLTLFAVLATIILTLVISPLLAFVVFEGMTERQTRRNGGPFAIGDRVVVIAGRHAGRKGRITSYGQCQTLRITIDGENEAHGAYSHYHLKRVGEQSDARETSSESVLNSKSSPRSP